MKYTDIGINLTNKQFQNDIESIIQNAIDAEVTKMIDILSRNLQAF